MSKYKCVKILNDAVNKIGSIPELHRLLLHNGVSISDTSLYNAYTGVSKSIKPEVISAICKLIYNGDWNKCGKALDHDFLADKLRK